MLLDSSQIVEVIAIGNSSKEITNQPHSWLNVKHHFQRQQQQVKKFISENKFAKMKIFNGQMSTVAVAMAMSADESSSTLLSSSKYVCLNAPTSTVSTELTATKTTSKTTKVTRKTATTLSMSLPTTMNSEVTTASATVVDSTHLQTCNILCNIISCDDCTTMQPHIKSSTLLSSDRVDNSSTHSYTASNSQIATKAEQQKQQQLLPSPLPIRLITTSSTLIEKQKKKQKEQHNYGHKIATNRISLSSSIWGVAVLLSTMLMLLDQTQSGKH